MPKSKSLFHSQDVNVNHAQHPLDLPQTELAEVVYTKDGKKPFQDFDTRSMPAQDRKLKIYFDEPEIYEDVMILLRFNCPDPGCDVACAGGWRELKEHVRKAHGMLMWYVVFVAHT